MTGDSGPFDDTKPPWLSILGLGEDGLAGLSAVARTLLEKAELVFGGARHLELAAAAIHGEARRWTVPLDPSIEAIIAARGRRVVVLASGDPFEHGVGVLLARRLDAGEWLSLPVPSAFSLAANRLGWALQEVRRIGLNGRALERLIPLMQPGARVLALSSDATTPALVAELLAARGFGASTLHVLEALGGPQERVRRATAAAFGLADIRPLNLLGLEITGPRAAALPVGCGLADRWFGGDGQFTKREVRAATLSALRPLAGGHLWDLGAGSGSIAIEWMLADPSCRASAVEARADRVATIASNAARLGVPGLTVIEGRSRDVLDGLAAPDAIFIGGGADATLIRTAVERLPVGGRLVVNAVTLETSGLVFNEFAARGGELVRIAVERAAPIGGFFSFQPMKPVVQWIWEKP